MKKIITIILSLTFIISVAGCNKLQQSDLYELELEYHENQSLTCNMTLNHTIKNSEGKDSLRFNLYPNAFRQDALISPLDKSKTDLYGDFTIISVKADGKQADYDTMGIDKNILNVKLNQLKTAGEKVKIEIAFALKPPKSNARLSITDSSVNFGNFYPVLCAEKEGSLIECEYLPIGDPFVSETADYKVKLTVMGEQVVAASGKAISCDVSDNKASYSYELKNVRDFAFALSEKYSVLNKKSGNKSINYYYYEDNEPEKSIEIAQKSLDYFSSIFGDYALEEYSVCQVGFNAGGMEYPGLSYINDSLDEENKLYTIVHETAHQWWYSMVGNDQINQGFLDEGLTEYSTALFFAAHPEYNVNEEKLFSNARQAYIAAREVYTLLSKPFDGVMIKNLKDFQGEYEYVNIAYNKGLLMMQAAENAIGREKTIAALKKYFNQNKGKIADVEALYKVLGAATPIVKAYVNGNEKIGV